MAKLNGSGVPTRKTIGAIGDIYTDTTTGEQYKCIFAYRSDNDEDFDCQWKKLDTDKKPYVKPEAKEVAKTAEEEPVEKKKEEPEQPKEETPVNETPQRTNYTAYSKKHK